MKLNKISLAIMGLAAFAMSSCSEDDPEYTPAAPIENPAEFYFSNADADKLLEVGDDETEFVVPVYRADKGAAETVNISVVNPDAAIFTIPSSVTFAEGSDEAQIVVTYNPENLSMNTDYDFVFKVDGASSDYYLNEAKVTLNYITWTTLGNATYTDGFICTLFNTPDVDYEVEVQENPGTPGLYRLVNPYGEPCPFLGPDQIDTTEDRYMYFNCTNPAKVFISDKKGNPIQVFYSGAQIGNYGEMVMGSVASINLLRGKDAEGLYGQLKNGNITFPVAKSLVFGMLNYEDGALFYAENDKFRVVLPGYEPDLPVDTWESLGNGTWTDGFICPMYGVSPAASYEVEVQENQDNPGVYRMINPYTDAFPFGEPADKDYYIVIDASNPECVALDQQETGFMDENDGMTVIANLGGFYLGQGKTPAQIIEAGLNDTMKDGVITIAGEHCLCRWPNATSEGTDPNSFYTANNPVDAVLALPTAANTSIYNIDIRRSPAENYLRNRKAVSVLRDEFRFPTVKLNKK